MLVQFDFIRIFLLMTLFFPGMSDILLFWQFSIIDFRIFCFGFVLFSCTSKMPFIYILDLYFQSFLSVILSTCFHLLFSFAFCAVFENCFLHHPLCFWSVGTTSFNIFVGAALVLILSPITFFNCQLHFHLILMSFDLFGYRISINCWWWFPCMSFSFRKDWRLVISMLFLSLSLPAILFSFFS